MGPTHVRAERALARGHGLTALTSWGDMSARGGTSEPGNVEKRANRGPFKNSDISDFQLSTSC